MNAKMLKFFLELRGVGFISTCNTLHNKQEVFFPSANIKMLTRADIGKNARIEKEELWPCLICVCVY